MCAHIGRAELGSSFLTIWSHFVDVVFILSLIFLWRHWGARFALAAFVTNRILFFQLITYVQSPFQMTYLLFVQHLFLWLPVVFYICLKELSGDPLNFKKPYTLWSLLLIAVITVCVLMDIWGLIRALSA